MWQAESRALVWAVMLDTWDTKHPIQPKTHELREET